MYSRSRKIGDIPDKGFPIKPKKFVFQIEPENIKFIESLSYQEKQIIINELIAEYRVGAEKKNKFIEFFIQNKNKIKVIFITLIAVPILLYILSLAWDATQSTNSYMQHNFEKLFY